MRPPGDMLEGLLLSNVLGVVKRHRAAHAQVRGHRAAHAQVRRHRAAHAQVRRHRAAHAQVRRQRAAGNRWVPVGVVHR